MDRKDILEEVKHFTTPQELREHHWTKSIGMGRPKRTEPGECLDTDINIWTFRHLYEKGLTATFEENDDGTYKFINCRDVTK